MAVVGDDFFRSKLIPELSKVTKVSLYAYWVTLLIILEQWVFHQLLVESRRTQLLCGNNVVNGGWRE